MAGALVEANDRLLGLMALTEVSADSLEPERQIEQILTIAVELLAASRAVVHGPVTVVVGGTADNEHQVTAVAQVDEDRELSVSFTRNGSPFGTPEQKIAQAVANLTARATRIGALHASALKQEVMVREHAAAARLAQGVLPPAGTEPTVSGVSVFAHTQPARLAGGDLYSWAQDGDRLGFAVGDVSGKGLPAAVMMASVVSAVQSAFRRLIHRGPDACIQAVHDATSAAFSDAGMFVTLCLGIWDPEVGELCVVNAGHSPVVSLAGGGASRIVATAPPIGVLDSINPDVVTWSPAAGDALILATDGMTEQENADGAMVGEDRFDDLARTAGRAGATAAVLGEALFAAVAEHAGNMDPGDDRTAMVLRFGPVEEAP